MQLRLSVIPLMQGTPWMTTSYPSLDWSFLNSIVSPMLELSVKTARWLCLFMCMDWCQGCCCIGVHGKFSRRMNLPWQLTQPLFWFCPFLHVNQHLISPEKQLEHNYVKHVKHVKQCLYVQWRTDHSEISRWASVENQINSKTHLCNISNLQLCLSLCLTNVVFKHVHNLLWCRVWCLSLLADSLKGHKIQLW
jgi:hypothetical protein